MSKILRKNRGRKRGRRRVKSIKKVKELEWLDLDEEDELYDEEYEDDEDYEIENEEDYDEDDEDYEIEDEEDYDEDDEDYEIEDEEDYDEDDEDYEIEDEEDYDEDEEDYEVDDDYDEYEDDYDYDEDYDDDEISDSVLAKIVYKITHMSAVDYIVAFTGITVLALLVFTGIMFISAKSDKKQVEAFAEIGMGMEDIGIIGESGLLAISDAQLAKLMAAELEQQVEETENIEEPTHGGKEVIMDMASIQKDLKIKFINKDTGKLISNIGFKVEIEKPSGGTYTKEDDDRDGIIYQTDLEPGKYKVKIIAPLSDDEYQIPSETIAITIRDTIEYKKIDVTNEIKTEAQVNVAVEDTKVNETVVESTNADTVEWVESTRTLIEGTERNEDNYEKVDNDQIADPGQTAFLGFRLLSETDGMPEPTGVGNAGEGENTGGGNEKPTEAPIPTEVPKETEAPTVTVTPVVAETPIATPTETPSVTPTETPSVTPTEIPSVTPTEAPIITPTAIPVVTPTATVTPSATPTITPSATPTVTPSATPSVTPTATPNAAKTDTKSTLKTTSGETLYVRDSDGSYREAKYADYYNIKEFYRKLTTTTGEYRYTGWQTIDGITYFFDKNGNKVTGEQVIQGAKYTFNSDGSLNTGSGHMGIDVSKWNGSINWEAVKNSGVSYAIIRCGYRGSTTGALIEDPMFRSNIQGASKAGIKVGIYFFTQATNEVEAVEEASMVLNLVKGYNISYPIFLDVEASNGRGDAISVETRTAVCNAFCRTIQNSGYKAGIYANKTWFNEKINTPSLTGYKIWLAQYAAAPTYSRSKYDMWQYSSKGKVSGISGNVDMNISYMGY